MINRVIDGCFCPSQASFTHIETSLSVVNSYRSIDLVYSSKQIGTVYQMISVHVQKN